MGRHAHREAEDSMAKLVMMLLALLPQATVHGHNEFAARACPCFDVQQWLREEKII